MGKKSKRKAPKGAVITGGSGSGCILGPRPDGITCTNEDPNKCALCSCALCTLFAFDSANLNLCCGTKVCRSCFSTTRCCYCKTSRGYQNFIAKFAKARANEGFPWACNVLAELHAHGLANLSESDAEAFRFNEIAASKDHVGSCISLAGMYFLGVGCEQNQEKGTVMYEKAVRLAEPHEMKRLLKMSENLFKHLIEDGEQERALATLALLVERLVGRGRAVLIELYKDFGDIEGYFCCHEKAAEDPGSPIWAMSSSKVIGNLSLARMWYFVVSKGKHAIISEKEELIILKETHQRLCDLRQECAWCQTSLDRSTRKMCKGCKAHCYCSEDCQRAHWNADENDHRSECQKVMEVKKKVAAMNKWREATNAFML